MSSLQRSQPTSQRPNLDSCFRDLGFLKLISASLFNLFRYLVLMHNLLDDVKCTAEKECSLSNFSFQDLFIWLKTEGELFSGGS